MQGSQQKNDNPGTELGSTANFVRHLWPGVENGHLCLLALPGPCSIWFPVADADGIAEKVAELTTRKLATYLACGLSPRQFGPSERCKSDQVIAIPGIWADIDIAGPAHKGTNLPATIEDATAIAMGMPCPPTMIVHSGHGIYPWWLLDRPWFFAHDERQRAMKLVRAWQGRLRAIANKHNWTIDSTHDLARVLRIPGSVNFKTEPRSVTFTQPGERYPWQFLEDLIQTRPAPPVNGTPHTSPSDADDRARAVEALNHLCRNRATSYETWIHVGMALHSVADDLVDAWDQWSRSCPDKYKEGECAKKWKSFSRGSGFTIGSLLHWAKSDAGWAHSTSGRSRHEEKPNRAPIDLNGVKLSVLEARKTSSKVVVNIGIAKDGARIDMVTVTSAASSRRDAAKHVLHHIPDVDLVKIEIAIGQLVMDAVEITGRPIVREGDTIHAIVNRVVLEDFRPAYRTHAGFFSESRGQEIRRQDLIGYTPSRLVDLAARGIDAPLKSDGTILRPSLLRAIKGELEVCFADLVQTLPLMADADLTEVSTAAREFRSALTRLLTTPKTWEASNDGPASRASLISRAKTAIDSYRLCARKPTRGWTHVLSACDCWWRVGETAQGEINVPFLAIRWGVAHQIGVPLPGVIDQESLSQLGTKFGVIDKNPPVSIRTNRNNVRLAVLTQEFIEPLLNASGFLSDENKEHVDNKTNLSTSSDQCAVHME